MRLPTNEIIGSPALVGADGMANYIADFGTQEFVLQEPLLWADSREALDLESTADCNIIIPNSDHQVSIDAFKTGGFLSLATLEVTGAIIETDISIKQDVELWKSVRASLRGRLAIDLGIVSSRPRLTFYSLATVALKRHDELAGVVDSIDSYFSHEHSDFAGLCATLGAGFVLHKWDECWDEVCEELTSERYLDIGYDDPQAE